MTQKLDREDRRRTVRIRDVARRNTQRFAGNLRRAARKSRPIA